MDKRKLGIGAIIGAVVLCVIGAVLIGGAGNLFGGDGGGLLGGGSAQGELGDLYVAHSIDQNGCPLDTGGDFSGDEAIYAGLERSEIPAGTDLFMRLYQDGRPIEDSPVVTADRDTEGCVWFEFVPSGQSFASGDYTAELIVNGNPSGQVAFDVTGGSIANTGGVELGTVYTTTRVTEDGCPTDDVATFFVDEPIFLSVEESFIPAGTELFARLRYEGEVVEDTDVIRAERDRESCVWFIFEPTGQGFDPGSYTAELFINGSPVESLPFDVQ